MDGRLSSQRMAWLTAPLLFVSGFCALIYQVVWTRELRLVFGATTAASSAVVAIFIAGLGFGGLYFGRRVERSANALRFYALLELIIALFSALTPLLLYLVGKLYVTTGGSLALGALGSTFVRLLLSALVLGPPTFLMGGTLPATARAIETASDTTRRSVALVYGVNTLGAVLGCTLSTFVLLEQLGSRATLFVAAALNLLVAAIAYLMSTRIGAFAAREEESGASGHDADLSAPAAPPRLVFVSAALVGFAFFLMELVWYRLLQPVLGGTVFAFGLILALALLGIGIGSGLYAALRSGRRAILLGFAITCVAEALCLALPYALGDRLSLWAALLRPLGNLGFGGLVFGWTAIAGIVVLPAAIVSGFQFPLLIALLGSGRSDVGRHVGTAYAANTLGAVLGALAGGFGLLPALGALGCFKLAVGLLAAWGLFVGLYAWTTGSAPARNVAWVAALFGLTVATFTAEGPTAVFRHAPVGVGRVKPEALASPLATTDWLRMQKRAIAWEKDGIESAIGIHRLDGVAFVVNGKVDGNARLDAATQVMGGLVGAALRPSIKRAMVIGLGTGSTAGWLASLPEIKRVDVAELEPAVLEVARQSRNVNERVLENRKVKIHRGDARELLTVSRTRYDLIFSEPSNPYRAGIASLYTREYYQAVKRHLSKQGVFVQWLQAYDIDARTLRTIYATLNSVFPYVETFHGRVHDLLLVATRKKPLIHAEQLEARLAQPPFARAMRAAWYTEGLEGFLAHYLANPSYARVMVGSDPEHNTDDRTIIEYGFARSLLDDPGAMARSFYLSMRRTGEYRPAVRGQRAIDWGRVDYEREAFAVATGSIYSPEHLTEHYRERLETILAWFRADFVTAGNVWNHFGQRQQKIEPTLLERFALAEVFASSGGPEVLPWIDALTKEDPILRTALTAHWQLQRGDRQEGVELMVQALERYRGDAWPVAEIMGRVLSALQIRHEGERELGMRLLAALEQPFAAWVNETMRQQARVNIGHRLGAREPVCVEVLAQLEPNVPWVKQLLEYRAECYRVHGHARRDLAERELALYREDEPQMFDQLAK